MVTYKCVELVNGDWAIRVYLFGIIPVGYIDLKSPRYTWSGGHFTEYYASCTKPTFMEIEKKFNEILAKRGKLK